MSWDWAIDTAKGLIAVVIAWLATYLRKQAKPILQALRKLGNIVKIINTLESHQSVISSEQLAFYHISKNPIFIVDNTGAVIYVNPAWVNMTGYRDDKDAYGYGYIRAVHPEDRDDLERQRAVFEKKPNAYQGIVRFKNIQTGEIIIAECISELIYDDKGKVVKTIGTLYVHPRLI